MLADISGIVASLARYADLSVNNDFRHIIAGQAEGRHGAVQQNRCEAFWRCLEIELNKIIHWDCRLNKIFDFQNKNFEVSIY